MKAKTAAAIVLILFLFSLPSFSQRSQRNRFTPFSSETQFSIGPEFVAVLPSGLGIGASLRYEQPLKVIDHLTVTATAGVIAYGTSSTYDTPTGSYTAKTSAVWIPLLGGAKYYYPGPIFQGLYGSLEAGFGFGSSSATYSGPGYSTSGSFAAPDRLGAVTVCPGAGYHNDQFDFTLRYFSVGIVSVRAAYVFKLRR